MTRRTRTVTSDRARERTVDEFVRDGYAIIREDDGRTVVRRRDHGGLLAHAALFVLVGWWTFGLANVVYATWRRKKSVDTVEVVVDE